MSRYDTRNMTPQQIADLDRQLMAPMTQPFTGQPKSPMQPQVQQPAGGFGQQNIKYGHTGGYNPNTKLFIPATATVGQTGPGPGQTAFTYTPGMPMPGQSALGGQPFDIMQRIQQVQQPARQLSPVRQYLDAMRQYRQGGKQGARPTYAQFKQQQQQANQVLGLNNQLQAMGKPGMLGASPSQMQQQIQQYQQGLGALGGGQQLGGIDAYQQFLAQQRGGTGMPPIGQPMSDGGGFGPGVNNYSAPQPIGQPMSQMQLGNQGQVVGAQPFGIAGGGTGMPPMPPMPTGTAGGVGTPPIGQPMGVAGGVGTPPQPDQPPMPMKKGGFAVKAVWDKERPEDLNKPKSLSAKKKKSAKARAKAAGRPYPNLVDNMAAARKKGK